MNFNFELLLTSLVIITGILCLLDACFFARKRALAKKSVQVPAAIEYARSFFPVLLLVLVLRSFIAEPFRIPTGSDKPTLLVGDFLIANKFAYGLRLPVLHTKIISIGEPKTGDIFLFRWPVDPSTDFIKRVIGVPGDKISYLNKILYINGKEATQQLLGTATDSDGEGESWPVQVLQENLNGVIHKIYIRPDVPAQDFSVTVPPGEYFAMGDNRDSSNDSRYWGFVPEQDLLGKAFAIWFSWDSNNNDVRWQRIGMLIH